MPVILEQHEEQCLIRLQSEVDIASAAELKKVLLQALASGLELRVVMEGATELDVTAWQLLWAAAREASRVGRKCFREGQLPQTIETMMKDGGFEEFPLLPSDITLNQRQEAASPVVAKAT
jgi:anti-anti-sigma regulatory factor